MLCYSNGEREKLKRHLDSICSTNNKSDKQYIKQKYPNYFTHNAEMYDSNYILITYGKNSITQH